MKIGIIGAGNMASAIIGGMIKKGVAEQSTLWGSDKTEKALATAQEKFGMHVTLDNCEVARNADILFLAVKPNFMPEVIEQIKDAVTEENLPMVVEMVKKLAQETGSIIAISGVLDVISDGRQTVVLRNGCATMSRITGSGCMLTSLIGAFCGAMSKDLFAATCAAVAVMGIAGEMAENLRLQKGTGNVTFRADLIDSIFSMTETELKEMVKLELF